MNVPYQNDNTMKELVPVINEIVKYGLYPNLNEADKEKCLEKHLVKIYNLFFEINYTFDESDFPDFDQSQLPDIKHNVSSNFKEFGFYKTIRNINDMDNNLMDHTIGDAIDDLSDIITDLLEIKWRIENNSLNNGLWFFQFIFQSHTQQHIIDLLNFMKQKNG